MSYNPCPNCRNPTEVAGELCKNCLDEIAEENELTEKIMKSNQPQKEIPVPPFCISCAHFIGLDSPESKSPIRRIRATLPTVSGFGYCHG